MKKVWIKKLLENRWDKNVEWKYEYEEVKLLGTTHDNGTNYLIRHKNRKIEVVWEIYE